MFIHGHVPADATQTIICPTSKDKNGDLSDIPNIALATIDGVATSVLSDVTIAVALPRRVLL